jgi:folate-binding protein YgfZ
VETIAPHLTQAGTYDSVTVSGPDAQTYLQSQISQEIRDLEVGGTRWTFLLEPTGKVEVLARVVRVDDETFRLETDPGFGEALLARVNRFKIRVKADTVLTLADQPIAAEAESRRVQAGWPRMGVEIESGTTIPAETGVTPLAVNFKKGCYPGQELVERMDSRGAAAPRSLCRLQVADGSAPGDPILIDGTEVGHLTSVDGTTALGYVKRSAEVGERISFA